MRQGRQIDAIMTNKSKNESKEENKMNMMEKRECRRNNLLVVTSCSVVVG
jgi:hypothetical protein